MKKLTWCGMGFLALILTGCDKSGDAKHDVQYYMDNTEERASQMGGCINEPTKITESSNCINAFAAYIKVQFSGYKPAVNTDSTPTENKEQSK